MNFSYMNDNFPKIYRTTREKLASPDAFWDVVDEDPEFREEMRRRVREDCASGEVDRMNWAEVPITRKGVPTAYITARNIPLPDKRLMVSIVWDVTEQKRLEAERWAMEAQLRHQQKLESIGTLAGGVAHEINNPINGIMNYAQLIKDRLPADSPLAEFTGEILHETERVATIVRNLLAFARTEKQSHSPARLADIIEGTLSLIRTVIRHDQITLTVKVPERPAGTEMPEPANSASAHEPGDQRPRRAERTLSRL